MPVFSHTSGREGKGLEVASQRQCFRQQAALPTVCAHALVCERGRDRGGRRGIDVQHVCQKQHGVLSVPLGFRLLLQLPVARTMPSMLRVSVHTKKEEKKYNLRNGNSC